MLASPCAHICCLHAQNHLHRRFRASNFQKNEGIPPSISTNAWNALRYSAITLALVPAAEKLWSCFHSRRAGTRLTRDRTVRLRPSRLAHWGLHQEVDEESRLSRLSAIFVCLLHIAGTLLLEYGSGSTQTHLWKGAIVSPSIRDGEGLSPNRSYFLDAGYILGRPDGFSDCIDVGPRNLVDFGIRVDKIPASRSVNYTLIPELGRNVVREVLYRVPNSGLRFEVFHKGKSRWFRYSSELFGEPSHLKTHGFSNETTACQKVNEYYFECSESNENRDFVSDMLASAAVQGTALANELFRLNNRRASLVLHNVSIGSPVGQSFKSEEDAHTEWVRNGMPRDQARKRDRMILYLNISGLKDGCNHSHAMPASNFRKLRGLKVSKPTFLELPSRHYASCGEYYLVVWSIGNRVRLGALSQVSKGYCSDNIKVRLCVRSKSSREHEVAYYMRSASENSPKFSKVFNFSVEGELSDTDALDIAIQGNVEGLRSDFVAEGAFEVDVQKKVANLIERGGVISGLLRVAGKGIQGKSAVRRVETATINIFGVVGLAILVGLVLMPIPMMLQYRKGIVTNVESSYKRAVMKSDGEEGFIEVPSTTPKICAEGMDNGNVVSLKHTFQMQ